MNDDIQQSPESLDERYDLVCTELTQTEQRSLVLHLLYVLYAFDYDMSVEAVADMFNRGFGIEIPRDSAVFLQTASISQDRELLDQMILPLIENWNLERLGVITRLILQLSLWELKNTSIDSAVIINEAIELAKCFAEKDSYKFINGVLDEYVKHHREKEETLL